MVPRRLGESLQKLQLFLASILCSFELGRGPAAGFGLGTQASEWCNVCLLGALLFRGRFGWSRLKDFLFQELPKQERPFLEKKVFKPGPTKATSKQQSA
jgi:hypothetical protein